MRKGLIYLIGVFVLGLAHGWLRATFSDPVSFAIAIAYLLVLRLLAEKVGNRKPVGYDAESNGPGSHGTRLSP